MKKIALFVLLAVGTYAANAQIKIPGEVTNAVNGFITPPAIGDVGKTSSGIADLLGSKLSLTGAQKTGVLGAVTSFLGKKDGIVGLAKTSAASYISKFKPLQSGLFGKLKTVLGAAKFASFLNLKPTGNGAGNLLSNLFF